MAWLSKVKRTLRVQMRRKGSFLFGPGNIGVGDDWVEISDGRSSRS